MTIEELIQYTGAILKGNTAGQDDTVRRNGSASLLTGACPEYSLGDDGFSGFYNFTCDAATANIL